MPAAEKKEMALALDIGTTTLCAMLCDANNLSVATASCPNSQQAHGQDVVSRLCYAQRGPTALKELQNAVLADIRHLLDALCAPLDLDTRAINVTAVAANPAMIHILAGIDPTPLGQAPYLPAFSGPLSLSPAELDLPLGKEAELYCLPAVSAYLGGDMLAGLLATELHLPGPTRLLLDIGTNGEIALARGGEHIACSAAAGPALGGLKGGEMLAAVCSLRKAGLLAENGRLLASAPGIELTQEHIRHLQLAVGAIRAAIETLLQAAACPPEEVAQVLVAGAFGTHLPEQSLLGTGLLPPIWAGRIKYAGNTALAGARLCCASLEARQQAQDLCGRVRQLQLAGDKGYQQRFMQYMKFPGAEC